MYTEAWWNYGYVGVAGAESYNVTAEYDAGFAKFGAYYTNVEIDNNINATSAALNDIAGGDDMKEVTLTASKSFGPLDASLAYISTDADDQNNGKEYSTVQAYLTLNF